MKKIILLGIIFSIFSGCAIFRTTDVTISNHSNNTAYICVTDFRQDGDMRGSSGGSDYIKLLAHTSTTYKLYDKGKVELTKPNRNFLKKNSNKTYEILNSPKKNVKAFNKTGEKITLTEENNLFDTTIMESGEVKDIEVFTINDFVPCAVNEQGIVLKTTFQSNILIITF